MQTATLTMMEVPSMPRTDSREAWDKLCVKLISDFGEASGLRIIETIVQEVGDMRMSVPGRKALDRMARNRRICARFTGDNHKELAIMFCMSENNIRRVLDEDRARLRRDAEARTM